MAPVIAGCCRMESLVSGEINILHIAMMNDSLAIRAENQWRATQRR